MHGETFKRTRRYIEIDECKLLFLAWMSAIIRRISEERETQININQVRCDMKATANNS